MHPALRKGLAENAIAIEPEPKNFRTLMANVYVNDLASRVTAHNVALGDQNGQMLQFELASNNSGDHRVHLRKDTGFLFESERQIITVRSETLDSLLKNVDPNTWLIWMDTQGYEGFILKGANEIMRQHVPIVLEFWPYGMGRANSFPALKQTLLKYDNFFDLSEDAPVKTPLTESALDILHKKFDGTINFTDILVV